MVPRYARPEMSAIWEPESKYTIWFEIEAHATQKLGELGVVPESGPKALWDWWSTNPKVDVEAIDAKEAVLKHDVIAFLDWVAEQVGPEARFMHQGMTSSDVLDTTLAVQLARASDILLADLDDLLAAIKRRAEEHKLTPTIGRSHGIHAEPVTFGLKLAQAYAEFDRCKKRLIAAREEVATCAISGAVGTFANIDPQVEEYVAEKLGLTAEPVSTQVIPRDRHAMFFSVLAVIASSIERLAVEVRHLQRTEVLEAEEYFAPGQKGSSAMPHKRNPILIDKLLIYPDRMQANMDRMGGLIHSQRVLLALTQAGITRDDAYRLVQRNAMKVWESDGKLSLLELLKQDAEVTAALSDEEIEEKFDLEYHLKHVDTIFARVFG